MRVDQSGCLVGLAFPKNNIKESDFFMTNSSGYGVYQKAWIYKHSWPLDKATSLKPITVIILVLYLPTKLKLLTQLPHFLCDLEPITSTYLKVYLVTRKRLSFLRKYLLRGHKPLKRDFPKNSYLYITIFKYLSLGSIEKCLS